MLRTLVVSNFVEFRSTQTLRLQRGANFLIGANSSGKTALVELTRRCLSKKKNPKVSSIPDDSKPASIICNFEMNQELANSVGNAMGKSIPSFMSSYSDKTSPTNTSVYSCCIVNEKPLNNEKQLFKVVCVYENPMSETNLHLHIQRFPMEGSKIKVVGYYDEWDCDISSNQNLIRQFVKLDEQIAANEDVEETLDGLSGLLNRLEGATRSVKKDENGIVENILQQLDGVVVVTFPVRGHGPLQWNQNPELGKADGGYGKYKNASDGAVILQDLLDSPDVDHQEADKTFSELICPNQFFFTKRKNQGTSSLKSEDQKYEIVVKRYDHEIQLMKVPEGILEARHFSLLLAHKKYQTICLEEPGRGMHPPMVQRIRDLLLRKLKRKTLMVISHKPSMVNFWAFDRMFVCRNIFHDGKSNHRVLSVRSAMLRQFQEDNFRKMLFSSSVLFIEGPTDRIVMAAIFDEILGTDLDTLDSGRKDEIQKRQQLVTEINIIDIDGITAYNPYRELSDHIKLPYLFLFDKDTVFKSKAKVQLKGLKPGKDLKPEKARFEILSACMALADGKDIHTFLEKDVVPQKATQPGTSTSKESKSEAKQGPSKKKKQKLESASKVKDCISMEFQSKASQIRNILKEMYLPEKRDDCVKDKQVPVTFNLKDTDDANKRETYLDKRAFIWRAGTIEDVIIKSIIEEEDEKMMELFNGIVRCETARKDKDLLKEALLEMDQHKAQILARHLLNCEEIKQFFDFMDHHLSEATRMTQRREESASV